MRKYCDGIISAFNAIITDWTKRDFSVFRDMMIFLSEFVFMEPQGSSIITDEDGGGFLPS